MPDYQNMFRQFGQDVSNAILSPLEARLKATQINREEEKYQKTLSEADEKKKLRQKAAESIRAKYGDEYADMFLAGEGASGIASLRRANADRIKALRESNRAKGGDRYLENFDIAAKMTQQANDILSGAMKKVADAKASGNDQQALDAMNQYSALYDGVSSMLKNKVYSIDKDLREAYATDLAKNAESVLKDLSPDHISLLDETVSGALTNNVKIDNDLLKDLDNASQEYGLDIDLSGIPSNADVQKFVWSAISKGDLQPEIAKTIMNVKDQETLQGIANDKSANQAARKLAASLLKQQVTLDSINPQIRKSLQEMPIEKLYEKTDVEAKTPIARQIQEMGKSEIKTRLKKTGTPLSNKLTGKGRRQSPL